MAALVMLATGWYLADPILSAGIGLLILWSSWRLLRESVEVLLESTPKGLEPAQIREAMAAVDGVAGAHDLHVWTVTSGLVALSCHVEVSGDRPWDEVLDELTALLRTRFGIAHVTLQPETVTTASDGGAVCSLDTESGRNACRVALAGSMPVAAGGHGHRH